MKKYIKQIATFAFIAVLASCSSDEDVNYTSVGGNVRPTTSSISRLDNNFTLPLNIFTKEGVTASKVEIFKNAAKTISDPIIFGDKVADATISGEVASFNTSALGSFDVFPETSGTTTTLTGKTGTFPLAILTTYSDGSTTKATWTLTVGKGIVWQIYNADGDPVTNATSGKSTVKYKDPTPVKITFAPVKKGTTTVTSIVGEWAKNDGAFSALPGTLPITRQDLDIAAIPYSTYGGITPGDVITYKFTVTAGTQTDVISTKITFVNQEFDADHSASISNSDETSKFSFATGLNYDLTDAKNAEITFSSPFGLTKSRNDVRVLFVKSTLDFDETDLFDAETAFNAGNKVTALTNLAADDVVLYKITRSINFGTEEKPNFKDVTYYGLMKVTDKIAGVSSQELSFSYKEGVLYQVVPTPPVVVAPAP